MDELWRLLTDPAFPFLRYALAAGLLSSVAFGVVGTCVVVRKMSYLAGAIAHCVLGGIGLALFCRAHAGWTAFHPLLGALAAALLAAALIGWISLHARDREDTAISAIWAVGMATGLILLARTPGYLDPMSYLFGNVLLLAPRDLGILAALDLCVLAVVIRHYNRLLALCFDSEFAALRGVPVARYSLLLLGMTAVAIVVLTSVIGIVLVIAMLTLPAAVAGQLTRRFSRMMLLATVVAAAAATGGIVFSFAWDLPAGPAMALLAGLFYLVALAVARLRSKQV